MFRTTDITLSGYIVGPIWWPTGAECFKPLTFSVLDYRDRCDGATLRDCVLSALQDGDFQSASIAQGQILITMQNERQHRVTRAFPLSKFADVADCLHSDPDW